MKSIIKKVKFYLQLWDGIWSIPLGMASFVLAGVVIQLFFTSKDDQQGAPGFYDPSFLQAAFYAAAILVFFNFLVWMGIYFNFRGIWRYYMGVKKEDGSIENKSKEDFNTLTPWQRIKTLLFLYCFLSALLLVLFKSLL